MLGRDPLVHKRAVRSVIILGFHRRLFQMAHGPYRMREDTRERIHDAGGWVACLPDHT